MVILTEMKQLKLLCNLTYPGMEEDVCIYVHVHRTHSKRKTLLFILFLLHQILNTILLLQMVVWLLLVCVILFPWAG